MNQDAMWAHYQNREPGVFAHSAVRLAQLVRLLPARARVLNIGIGDGTFEELALARGLDVHALDPDAGTVHALRAHLALGERAQAGRAEAIPFPDQHFDAVVLAEVLEHLDERTLEQARNEVHRVLRPGGRVIVTVPAREDLAAQQVVCPHCGHRHHRWGHLQSFDEARLRAFLATRFSVESLHSRLMVAWATINWKGRLIALLKLLLHHLGVHGSGEILVAVARRQP
jgi:SAM-dependent methyltransferase